MGERNTQVRSGKRQFSPTRNTNTSIREVSRLPLRAPSAPSPFEVNGNSLTGSALQIHVDRDVAAGKHRRDVRVRWTPGLRRTPAISTLSRCVPTMAFPRRRLSLGWSAIVFVRSLPVRSVLPRTKPEREKHIRGGIARSAPPTNLAPPFEDARGRRQVPCARSPRSVDRRRQLAPWDETLAREPPNPAIDFPIVPVV